MNKIIITAIAITLGFTFSSISSASDVNLEEFGDPAIISFHAERAIVITDTLGQRITFKNASTLATLTTAVHIHDKRIFTAFPLNKLPEAWNSCNAMKFENSLFHSDGVNSVMTFSSGSFEHGHLSTAPLITQTDPIEKTIGEEEGTLYMMLVGAKGDRDALSFEVLEKNLLDGEYLQVQVSTECASSAGALTQLVARG